MRERSTFTRAALAVTLFGIFGTFLSQLHAQDTNYYPFSTKARELFKLGSLDPANTNLGDFSNRIRNQGAIGSCASHGILALLENQLFLERGITVELSERYMLYANLMHAGNIGDTAEVIRQYPFIVANWGLMPASTYPYSFVLKNSSRFTQVAAQNLANNSKEELVDQAIAGSTGERRSSILQKDIFLGPLPAGEFPVRLPMKAAFAPGAFIPEIEDRTVPSNPRIVSCFSDRDVKPQLSVTPREFINLCFDVNPKSYFSCDFGLDAVSSEALPGVDPSTLCADKKASAAAIAKIQSRKVKSVLPLTMRLLDQGQAVFIGLNAPAQGQVLSVWSGKQAPGAGHAVLVLGYLTYAELLNPEEGKRGLLSDGTFDRLATAYDQILKGAGRLTGEVYSRNKNDDAATLHSKRLSSNIGKLMEREGGMVFFRNSWGEKLDGVRIGADGYQAMTFDYFLKNAWLILSRSNRKVPGLVWQDGPLYCPVDRQTVASNDPWINRVQLEAALAERAESALDTICPAAK